jgi:DNA-binding SARP family transcriptional activator
MRAEDAAGHPVLPRVRKTRAVLAILALAAPRPVLRTQIIALLWSRRDLQQARGSLRQALHELQASLGHLAATLLSIDRLQVALRADGLWMDLAAAPQTLPTENDISAPGLLDDLDGIDPAFDRWLTAQRRKLFERARTEAEQALQAAASPAQTIRAAQALLVINKGHEGAWQALIRGYLERGDRPAAVASFEACRSALADVAQLTPSATTVALLQRAQESECSGAPSVIRSAALPAHRPAHLGRLRVGVAQLRALPGSAASELAVGLAEELVAALVRFRWISCVPVSSLVPFVGADTADAFWSRLGIDFLLDGTVQQAGERVRVIARLIDLRVGGEVVWSGRFDRDFNTVLTVQEDIAGATVAQLESKLLVWEGDRLAASELSKPNAAQLLRTAVPALFRLDRLGFEAAGAKLRDAMNLDPQNPEIYVWLTQWHLFALGQGWVRDASGVTRLAQDLASRAIDLAPDDARALTLAGHVRGFVNGRPDEALDLHERALAANPNLPLAWCRSAFACIYAGKHREALERAEQAKRLSPEDPLGFLAEGALSLSYLLLSDYTASIRFGARAIALNPGFSSSYKAQLAALGHLGRDEQADEIRIRLLSLEPGFSVSQALERSPIRRPEDRARYAEGLRLGGLS